MYLPKIKIIYIKHQMEEKEDRSNAVFEEIDDQIPRMPPRTISTILPPKLFFNHGQFGQYADSQLQKPHQLGQGITLRIIGNQMRGSNFMKYIVYHIVGDDKNGKIDVFRRFNQFFKMRTAMGKRFPGCFIPSIPEKTISLVDSQLANKRQRYLHDFLRKITKLPHLYLSEQFQALLRSESKDLSATFQKWPNPTSTEIINKYKAHFSDLAGKVITTEVRTQIHNFAKLITKTQRLMAPFKQMVKDLAGYRDKYDKNFPNLFSKRLPSFEHQCLVECVKDQSELISINQAEAKFHQHEVVVAESLRHNPYWLLYDLVKHQERDSKAFLETIAAVEAFQNRKYQLDLKISQNNKAINELILDKKSNSEHKYKLEVQNQNHKKQKEAAQCLTDIIIALVAFVQIDRFKRQKTQFFLSFLKKLGGYEINMVQNIMEVWKDWNLKTEALLAHYDHN